MKYTRLFLLFFAIFLSSCLEPAALAISSFGSSKDNFAGADSVLSMGRDDDDGAAIKWHIGGGEE